MLPSEEGHAFRTQRWAPLKRVLAQDFFILHAQDRSNVTISHPFKDVKKYYRTSFLICQGVPLML